MLSRASLVRGSQQLRVGHARGKLEERGGGLCTGLGSFQAKSSQQIIFYERQKFVSTVLTESVHQELRPFSALHAHHNFPLDSSCVQSCKRLVDAFLCKRIDGVHVDFELTRLEEVDRALQVFSRRRQVDHVVAVRVCVCVSRCLVSSACLVTNSAGQIWSKRRPDVRRHETKAAQVVAPQLTDRPQVCDRSTHLTSLVFFAHNADPAAA